MLRLHLADLPETEQSSPSRTFRSFCRNLSLSLGGIRNTGTWGGGHPFDLQIRRVPSGAAICPLHAHLAQWELFYVLAGTGTVRLAGASHPVRAGHVFVHPPGEAHQLLNSGTEDLEVLIVADHPPLDAFYYPDSDKWGLRPPGGYFRATPADYFDGEEPPGGAAAPPLPLPSAPSLNFASRLVHVDALPWAAWSSPRGHYSGAGKELSIALGAQRRAPVGLGGHPFDLELGRLAPGACPCPYHSHAAQWECYFFLSGAATVRTPAGRQPVRAGEVVLHPPGEPHQFANTGDTELLYLLVADNPPVDYWHYPDSNKWGFPSPRTFFRLAETDYWDGEEAPAP